MKRLLAISLLLFLWTSAALCQDLLIRYDVVNKNVDYFKVKKSNKGETKLIRLKSPKVGAHKSVKIEYVNINPFIWGQPQMNMVAVAQDSISSFNPFTMLIPSSLSDKMGPLSLGLTRDAGPLDKQQELCLASLDSLYDAYDKIDALKYNYKLTKQEIIDQSNEKLKNVMKTCANSENTNIKDSNFTKNDFLSMKKYFKDVCQVNIPEPNRSADNSKLNSFLGQSGVSSDNIELMPKDAVEKIEKDYSALSDADFSFENSLIVNDKDVILHMSFDLTDDYKKKAAKDSASAVRSMKHPQPVKDESIFIPVAGGVRISNSAGIGFTYLGPQRKSFYVNLEDSTLTSSVDHRIVPIVGTFLNVYSKRLGVVNIGGSFGLSVALQEVFSLNYMFGITTVFGIREKVLLSVGMVLSPVNEPTKGYYEGMHTVNEDFPTKVNYKPGLFIFVHYNIGKF
jgi:hypothetical protein